MDSQPVEPFDHQKLEFKSGQRVIEVPHPKAKEGLKRITGKGVYIYDTVHSPISESVAVKAGPFLAPNLSNGTLSFASIYGSNQSMVYLVDYEWQFLRNLGKLAIKIGTGVASFNGSGRFASDTTQVALEKYNFYVFPNNIGAIYRFQYFENQPIVPYVEGGADYYAFAEIRDDNKRPKYGGAAATHASAGLFILLDYLDRQSILELDNEHGVNHVWLTVEFKVVLGLNPNFDFSNNFLNAGIAVDF